MGASPLPLSSLATVLNVAWFWAAPPRTPRLHHLESLGELPALHTPALMESPASAFPPHTSLAAPGPSPRWPGLCPRRRQRAGSGAGCCQTLFHLLASPCSAAAGRPLSAIWWDSGLPISWLQSAASVCPRPLWPWPGRSGRWTVLSRSSSASSLSSPRPPFLFFKEKLNRVYVSHNTPWKSLSSRVRHINYSTGQYTDTHTKLNLKRLEIVT